MKHLLIALFLLCFVQTTFAQSYNGPESAEFDYANRRWLIGNTGSHQILSRDSLGNLTVLVNSTTNGPYGIEIVGDTVFCCSGGSIKGYLLSNGSQVFNVNCGGSFLNGLTHDNAGNLIATDFTAKKIFKINISGQSFTTIATGMTTTPNGIVFDEANNRCVFINWGSNVAIKAINMSTNAITTLLTTSMSSCDGITRDGAGRYYISNWGQQSVVRYDSSFLAPPTTVATGLSSPADIFYNVVDDTLAIPNSGNNTVRFIGFNSAVGIAAISTNDDIQFYPNPVKKGDPVHFKTADKEQLIRLFDVKGNLIRELNSNSAIETDLLEKGIYLIESSSGKRRTKLIVN